MYEPLEYTYYQQNRTPDAGMSTCMVVALAVVAVTFLMMQNSSRTRTIMVPMGETVASGVTSMIATVSNAVSARVSGDAVKPDDAQKLNPKFNVGAATVIDGEDTDEAKKKNEAKLRKWMSGHERSCIVFFAHWCPHCHALIEALVEHANANADRKVSFLLVNGDALPASAVSGGEAVVDLKYYPTILCKIGTETTQAPSLEKAMTMMSGDEAVSAKVAAPGFEMADEEATTADDPFDSLF